MWVDRRLLVLALGAFVVTADGTLVVGLLPEIARSVRASPSVAGLSITVFGLVYALVSPAVIRATRAAPQHRVLVGALALFAVANTATAAASSVAALLASRALAGACAGVFLPTAAVAAAAVGGRQRAGRALAVVVGGASAATVLGVPLGTLAGGAVGWRPVFYTVALTTAAITIAATALSSIEGPTTHEAATPVVDRRGTLITLTVTLLWATGSFTFFTHVGTVLRRVAGVGVSGLAGLLLVFGLAGIAGAISSGWISDARSPLVAIRSALVTVAVALAGLALISPALGPGASMAATIGAMAAYGFGTWAVTPPQQRLLISGGGDERLLLSFNASAVHGGVALGSAVGGLALALTDDATVVCALAATLTVVALLVSTLCRQAVANGPGTAEPGGHSALSAGMGRV